jgi:hypothetical protein
MLTKELSTVQRIQPYFIEPMYAEAVPELPDGSLWSYEAKFDGYRCLWPSAAAALCSGRRRTMKNVQRRMQLSCGWQKTVLILIPDTKCNAGDLSCNSTGETRRS